MIVTMGSSKRIIDLCLAGGIITAFLAGLLAITKRSIDIYVFDRYLLVLPSRLLLVSAALLLTAFGIWLGKISH
jgi:hypothetical protein